MRARSVRAGPARARPVIRSAAVIGAALVFAVSLPATPIWAKPPTTLRFQQSTVSFATPSETATLLTANDAYRQQLSPTDRQLLAVSTKQVTPSAMDLSLRAAAREFTATEKTAIGTALADADTRLTAKGIALNLPANVVIAKHDGAIFDGSPYTRTNTVFLNDRFLASVGSRPQYLASTLAHELWHIASRAHPELRAAVYKLVGFLPCNVPLSSIGNDIRSKIITNPDTEDFGRFCISLPDGAAQKRYTNLIIATGPVTGSNFGEILKPVLVEVNLTATAAVVKFGKTSVRDLDFAYGKAIGGNGLDEPYHPEEIVAKNLETALAGKASPMSPNLDLANRVAAQLGKP